MRVLVTGSRGWSDETAIRRAFAEIAMLHGPENMTIVHGACVRGADALADEIARAWTGMTIERHPAEWGRYGKRAGFMRNQVMVDEGADVCLAFIVDGSRGATHCAERAALFGIPVRYHRVTTRGAR
jgi:hypothetical protein